MDKNVVFFGISLALVGLLLSPVNATTSTTTIISASTTTTSVSVTTTTTTARVTTTTTGSATTSPLFDFSKCSTATKNGVAALTGTCADIFTGSVSSNGALNSKLANALSNATLTTACATSGCIASLVNTLKSDKDCRPIVQAIRNMCTVTKTSAGPTYCMSKLGTYTARLLGSTAAVTADEFANYCKVSNTSDVCFFRTVNLIMSLKVLPGSSVLAPMAPHGEAFCETSTSAAGVVSYCFPATQSLLTTAANQGLDAALNVVKAKISDNTLCNDPCTVKAARRIMKVSGDKFDSVPAGDKARGAVKTNIFPLLQQYVSFACNTNAANKTCGSYVWSEIDLALKSATATTRQLQHGHGPSLRAGAMGDVHMNADGGASSGGRSPPTPPPKRQGIKDACAALNTSVVLSGCCAVPIKNFYQKMFESVKTATLKQDEDMLRVMRKPDAICGIAADPTCSNGKQVNQVQSQVRLPGLNCTALLATTDGVNTICEMLNNTVNALQANGVVDDTSMTESCLCGTCYSQCLATAAANTTSTARRQLQTTTEPSLSTTVTASSPDAASLLSMQLANGATTDAVNTAISSLSSTSSTLLAAAAPGGLVASDLTDPAAASTTAAVAGVSAGTATTAATSATDPSVVSSALQSATGTTGTVTTGTGSTTASAVSGSNKVGVGAVTSLVLMAAAVAFI